MVAFFFVPKHLAKSIIVYQTNTGHRASSFYNESNAQNKFTFKRWSCHAFNVVHQPSSFCALRCAIFADEQSPDTGKCRPRASEKLLPPPQKFRPRTFC